MNASAPALVSTNCSCQLKRDASSLSTADLHLDCQGRPDTMGTRSQELVSCTWSCIWLEEAQSLATDSLENEESIFTCVQGHKLIRLTSGRILGGGGLSHSYNSPANQGRPSCVRCIRSVRMRPYISTLMDSHSRCYTVCEVCEHSIYTSYP